MCWATETTVTAIAFLALLASSAYHQEGLTPWERDYYDLDLKFSARVTLESGEVVELTQFRVGRGLQRHKVLTGNKNLNIALKAVKRIVRSRSHDDWVVLHFDDGVTMNIVWPDYRRRKIYGKLPDGGRWEATIDRVREIEVILVDENTARPTRGAML